MANIALIHHNCHSKAKELYKEKNPLQSRASLRGLIVLLRRPRGAAWQSLGYCVLAHGHSLEGTLLQFPLWTAGLF